MFEYHALVALAAVMLGLIGFAPYFRDIFKGTTKPHVFTWAVWSLLTGLTAIIQLAEGGGAGAWVTTVESFCCLGVFALSFSRGEKNITRLDWYCFILALVATLLWLLAHQALLAILLIVVADSLGYGPTLRKSYVKPNEETAMLYILSAFHWLLSIVGLGSITLVTALYPVAACCMDIVLISLLFIRRRQLSRT